ncbi:MAG: SOS response-associated peptidase, partial [Candidatus Saccharimonadaceae bacterium]|nr:SOS response-associated peptidase [Candidatus Saccharimonadaceae bacterium]
MLGYLQEYFNIYDPETEYQLPRYNIAPNEQIPAVIFDGTQYRFRLFKWGFIPGFAKTDRGSFQMINAKAETITEKNAFKTAFQKSRCLIPVSGFFEWQQTEKKKIPYYITLESIPLFALAGIWSQYRNEFEVTVDTCALITAAATKQLLPIHHRMPVIIAPENNRFWLDCN